MLCLAFAEVTRTGLTGSGVSIPPSSGRNKVTKVTKPNIISPYGFIISADLLMCGKAIYIDSSGNADFLVAR